jgi:hypothetical protein
MDSDASKQSWWQKALLESWAQELRAGRLPELPDAAPPTAA